MYQRGTRIGAGTLRRSGDPDSHGLHVYDTQLTADTIHDDTECDDT